MKKEIIKIKNIPAIVWGEHSDKVFIYVHGKCQNKEYAESFAEIADKKGYQILSFDLPKHGDRVNENIPCDIWNGISDLQDIISYATNNWKKISLFGCSIGAFFALHAYKFYEFETCLFHSPIIDMEYLINQMFLWFNVNEKLLQEKGDISTPVETLSWKYYCYVKEHPISAWKTSTHILFGGKDTMQTEHIMQRFIKNFGGTLTISNDSEHAFLSPKDKDIVNQWLLNSI